MADAAYYIRLVCLLKDRLNEVEKQPGRGLGTILEDVDRLAGRRVRGYPPDDVLLSEPGWPRMCPARSWLLPGRPLSLSESLALAAERA